MARPILLAAYDGSRCADAALRQGRWLTEKLDADLVGLIVREATPTSVTEPKPWTTKTVDAVRHRFSERVEDFPREVRVEVVRGVPGPAIVQAARSMKARWILMGTHGRTGMERLLVGSVAEYVLTRADVPVIVQGLHRKKFRPISTGGTKRARRLVLGVDENAFMPLVAHQAFALATAVGARVTAIHVVPAAGTREAAETEGRRVLAPVLAQAKGQGIPVDPAVVRGRAAPALIDCATAEGADLIVVGTHSRKWLARMVLGSVAAGVIREAACPVLVVPRNAVGADEHGAGDTNDPDDDAAGCASPDAPPTKRRGTRG